ncbi:MAG: phosphoribosylformylglycinamidine cyclo-ligase [bacterium]
MKKKEKSGLSYEDAGVSIDTMEAGLKDAAEIIKSTYRAEVLSHQGQFGGLFALDKNKYDEPILVSSTDGVGTKLKIAFMANKHNTVGEDLVAHCGNDIVVLGAEPLFFLDYLGTSKLDRRIMVQILDGLSRGCREIGCALIGGETAEMPSFYQPGEYDLVGTIVGVVDRKCIVDGSMIKHGDIIIGLGSSGLHTNGYSLARKILFELCGYSITDFIDELNISVCDEFLKPHRSYVKTILGLISKFNNILPDRTVNFKIKGLAHITGGGLIDNIPRILPKNCNALIEKGSWDILPVFKFLQKRGDIEESEMFRVFNMGIGMIIIVSPEDADSIMNELKSAGEKTYKIGVIIEGNRKVVLN